LFCSFSFYTLALSLRKERVQNRIANQSKFRSLFFEQSTTMLTPLNMGPSYVKYREIQINTILSMCEEFKDIQIYVTLSMRASLTVEIHILSPIEKFKNIF